MGLISKENFRDLNLLPVGAVFGSSGINGTQIFACYCDRVLGHRYLLWLKIFAVPFLPLDPSICSYLDLGTFVVC